MNQERWKTDDKAWMAQRKDEWRKVKENLGKMDNEVLRRGHKYHKELFFQGSINPLFSDSTEIVRANLVGTFGSCPLFFKMWYYPEASEEDLADLFYREGTRHSHRAAIELLFGAFTHADFSSSYGMLGGREESFVKVLMPGLDWKEKRSFSAQGEQYTSSIHPGLVFRYCIPHTAGLLSSYPINPHAPGQYLWTHLIYACAHYPDLVIREDERAFWDKQLRKFVHMILDFEIREGAPTDCPEAVNLRSWLYKNFEQGAMPEMLMSYWREEKAKFEAEHSG